jgi:TRAP-type mannitol/chloroaromatic compound transport system permease small subunit
MSVMVSKERGFAAFLKLVQRCSLRFHKGLTIAVSLWAFLTIFQVTGDVVGRYVFLSPIPGTYVIAGIMLVFLVYLSASYTEMIGGHIRIDLISARLSHKWRAILEIVGIIFGLFGLSLLTWQALLMALRSWHLNEIALDFPFPIYIGKFAIFVGFLFLSVQFVLNLCTKLIELVAAKSGNHQ